MCVVREGFVGLCVCVWWRVACVCVRVCACVCVRIVMCEWVWELCFVRLYGVRTGMSLSRVYVRTLYVC